MNMEFVLTGQLADKPTRLCRRSSPAGLTLTLTLTTNPNPNSNPNPN